MLSDENARTTEIASHLDVFSLLLIIYQFSLLYSTLQEGEVEGGKRKKSKSVISQVHECALQMKLTVEFEVRERMSYWFLLLESGLNSLE